MTFVKSRKLSSDKASFSKEKNTLAPIFSWALFMTANNLRLENYFIKSILMKLKRVSKEYLVLIFLKCEKSILELFEQNEHARADVIRFQGVIESTFSINNSTSNSCIEGHCINIIILKQKIRNVWFECFILIPKVPYWK